MKLHEFVKLPQPVKMLIFDKWLSVEFKKENEANRFVSHVSQCPECERWMFERLEVFIKCNVTVHDLTTEDGNINPLWN